jgi:hypothetical protein
MSKIEIKAAKEGPTSGGHVRSGDWVYGEDGRSVYAPRRPKPEPVKT